MHAGAPKGRRRWARRAAGALIVLSGSLLAAGFALECRPSWYRPVAIDDAVVHRAKVVSADLADLISRGLVAGETFDVTLAAESVNEMAAAWAVLSPESAARVPRGLSQLAVSFDGERVQVGMLAERSGWRAAIQADCEVRIPDAPGAIVVALRDVRVGAVSVPRWLLRRVADPHIRIEGGVASPGVEPGSDEGRFETVDDLFRGVSIRNRFVWPNGRRSFRVDRITLEHGVARVRIQPLD